MKIRKPIFAILILLVLTGIMGAVVVMLNASEMLMQADARNNLRSQNMTWSLKVIEAEVDKVYDSMRQKTDAWAKFMASSLRAFMEEDQYIGEMSFTDGFVVKLQDGEVYYSEDFEYYIEGLDAEAVEKELTLELMPMVSDDRTVHQYNAITTRRIGGDYWYVDVTPWREYSEMQEDQKKILNMVNFLQEAFDGYLFLFESRDPEMKAYYVPDAFSSGKKIEDLGITQEMYDAQYPSLMIDKKHYMASYSSMKLFKTPMTAVFIVSSENMMTVLLNNFLPVLLLVLVTGIVVILWLYWVQVYVRDHELSETEKAEYHPSHIRRRVRVIGALCILLLVTISGAINLMGNLSVEADNNNKLVDLINERLTASESIISHYRDDVESWMDYYAQQLARLLIDYPEFRTGEFLADAADKLKVDYIVLFDEKGKEIVSSNGLIDLDLTTDFEESEGFKKLLLGVPGVIGNPLPGLFGEEYTQMIGGSAFDEYTGKYKSVLISIDPVKTWKNDEKADFATFLSMVTPNGNASFVVNREDGTVIYSNMQDAVERRGTDIGLYADNVSDTELDSFRILLDQGIQNYYGAYQLDENYQYYYMTDAAVITEGMMPHQVAFGVGFLIIYWVITAFMLHPYKADLYNEMVKSTKTSLERSPFEETLFLEWAGSRGSTDDQENLHSFWKRLLPEKKATFCIQTAFWLLLILILYLSYQMHSSSTRSWIDFILRGNWSRGVHLISFAGIMILVFAFAFFVMFKNLVLNLITDALEPKAKTISKLVLSLVQYAGLIVLLYFGFNYLGFDTRALLASVSILSLAVTLGAKDLVADILAGVFIIFEDQFRVGDIIEVNGFSGVVEEIGVRSTRLVGIGDNIKIIGNESVKNVLNMSKMNSWYSIDLKVPSDQPIMEIEDMLRHELPAVGDAIPEIISGPYYKGVMALSGTHTLYIIAECRQENYRKVQRALNHAILALFKEHGYKFGGF